MDEQKIKPLDPAKPVDAQDLFESIRETRAKINEIINSMNAQDTRQDVTDRALAKNIQSLALHKHAETTGEAVTPLAV